MCYKIFNDNCLKIFESKQLAENIDLTFLDPPFNQNKEYSLYNDNLPEQEYWKMMKTVCIETFKKSSNGAAIYFMQREKNTQNVLKCLRDTGWTFQNLIIWKKKTSAIPCKYRFGKNYQIIVFATKGKKPRIFTRLRISPPLPKGYKYERSEGMFVTDIWEDIRELTSGYFAGDEAIRKANGDRHHKQQSPISLLLRIILSSSKLNDIIFDPFAGTGTTLVVAYQLKRKSIGIEIDPDNVKCIKNRLENIREADNILKYYQDYIHTKNLSKIWLHKYNEEILKFNKKQMELVF